MEYLVDVSTGPSCIEAAREAVRSSDPAATVEVVGPARELRVATSMDAEELRAVLGAAGLAVGSGAIARQASTCCGGCAG